MPGEGLVLTVQEIARDLRVHTLTVRRAIDRGEIPSVKVGRRVLVPRKAFEDWLAKTTNGEATPA